jgi:hypothetical protein
MLMDIAKILAQLCECLVEDQYGELAAVSIVIRVLLPML